MTTQDKPAVGPLSAAKELERLNAYNPDDVDLEIIKQRVVAVFDALIRLAPTAPADVSTKPLETNTSAEHVKETAKNEHVTAPVEAGGWDEAKLIAYEDAHAVAVEMGYPSLTEALEHLAALRPQPSGETREAVAARIRRLVSLADADFSFVAREVYVSKETDAILALLRPAAPGGGDDLRAACQAVLDDYQTSETHHPDHILIRRADFERIAVILSSIPASEGGEG